MLNPRSSQFLGFVALLSLGSYLSMRGCQAKLFWSRIVVVVVTVVDAALGSVPCELRSIDIGRSAECLPFSCGRGSYSLPFTPAASGHFMGHKPKIIPRTYWSDVRSPHFQLEDISWNMSSLTV